MPRHAWKKLKERDYLLFPLYHPASVIYNRALVQVFESDILKLRELSMKW